MSQEQIIPSYKTLVRHLSGGQTEVIYYETTIVRFDNGEIWLNTGDWWTASTKIRMNQVSEQFELGYRVFVKNSKWYVTYQGKDHQFTVSPIRLDRTTGEVMSVH
jgi:hypothetical protein